MSVVSTYWHEQYLCLENLCWSVVSISSDLSDSGRACLNLSIPAFNGRSWIFHNFNAGVYLPVQKKIENRAWKSDNSGRTMFMNIFGTFSTKVELHMFKLSRTCSWTCYTCTNMFTCRNMFMFLTCIKMFMQFRTCLILVKKPNYTCSRTCSWTCLSWIVNKCNEHVHEHVCRESWTCVMNMFMNMFVLNHKHVYEHVCCESWTCSWTSLSWIVT